MSGSHFETVADDVLSIYKRIPGHDLDLTLPTEESAQWCVCWRKERDNAIDDCC